MPPKFEPIPPLEYVLFVLGGLGLGALLAALAMWAATMTA